jgi:3-phenylpropionate/trans-cinnamate dioxygenase ferredoxin subunit
VFDDRAVLLLRVGDEFFAVEDVCSHDGQPLTDGPLEGTAIECPRHGARFDVRTGRPLCMPAVEPIATYEVKVVGNDILLRDRG